MASRFATLMAEKQTRGYSRPPECIADIEETSNCYYVVYDGPYAIAEGSLSSIKYKLPASFIERPFKFYEPNKHHPRIVNLRF